jgi:hypothetical protein
MKTLPAAALLFALFVSAGAAEPLYYRSNGSAMALERIPSYRRDESDWILSVERTGPSEVRILYDKGNESRRWVRITSSSQVEEKELAAGLLAARRVYDAGGSLLQEDLYAAGALATRTTCAYAGGRLVRTRTVDPSGKELFTDDYIYASNGSLRSVRRSSAGSVVQASVVSGAGGISEERTAAGDTTMVARYDAKGRVTSREKRTNGLTVSREDFVFRTDKDALASSTEKIPAQGRTIERVYDEEGRLSQETTTLSGGSNTVVTWTRDSAGRVAAKVSRGPAGLETWTYTLREDGSEAREEYARKGSLEKVTIFGEGAKRTEELYRDGELFLTAYYDGDKKLKEEVWSSGNLVRTRTYP